MSINHCSVCKTHFGYENIINGVKVCPECGHTESEKEKSELKDNLIFQSLVFVLFISSLAFSLFYFNRWNAKTLSALPLEIKYTLGLSSVGDRITLAEYCEERKNLACVIKYTDAALKKQPNNLKALEIKAHNLYLHKEHDYALKNYKLYFSYGGASANSYYELGRIYEEKNELKLAIENYKKSIDAKPGILQITVLEHYVNTLINDQQIKKAIDVIEYVQKNARRMIRFMDATLVDLQKKSENQRVKSAENRPRPTKNLNRSRRKSRILTLPPKVQGRGA